MRFKQKATMLVALLTGACVVTVGTNEAPAAAAPPRPDHVVIVVLENHAYGQVIQNSNAPYISSLVSQGANLTQSFGVTHPSEPNYLALYSGSPQGLTDDSCPHTYGGSNLGQQLLAAGRTFAGYSEGMPSDGYTGCTSGRYARKHNPWVNFTNVPASANLRYTRFPTDYTKLPTVSFVIPDLCNDMHDCSVATGDAWVKRNLDGYVQWARTHNSVFLLTFDEDDHSASNRIPTVLVGQHVRTMASSQRVTHYGVLRTLQDMYGVACTANSCSASAISGIWN
ncbi:alkaline phosphatase family protein [Planosporangium mesophilum]|uniref:Acid phosphatase n=1 Tax=Planosporangium mesophilum TaxID=689768 RepID=A0A8J3T8A7_9ACTN|nr:alkaline phosphatase family protein [Planosporangium mesophilum]GII20911.1 acid phosphatase [Planosporangium mesophilum]